jgi:DNA-binding PucR family transcriptional regulator
VPAEAIEANAELVHRGMPLDQVLRGVRIGHAWLHHALMTALDAVPEAVRGQEAHRVGGLLFAYADTHASRMAEEYVAERDRWQGSTEVARRRIVADLLAGRRIDTEEAAGTLGYHLSGHHLAFIIWARDLSAPAEAIYRFATRLVSAAGCDGWLAVPAVLSELWVWASWAARPPPGIVTDLRGLVTPPAGIQVTAGPVASGPQGVRRSHLGAQEASRVARMGDAGSWLCDYAQVRAVSLLTADLEHARWYVREVLGALSGADDRIRELRETLREYLVSGRSLPGAGERLQLARNTVGYRVRRAEEILGRPLDEDGWEIRLALEIAAVLPAGPAEQGG